MSESDRVHQRARIHAQRQRVLDQLRGQERLVWWGPVLWILWASGALYIAAAPSWAYVLAAVVIWRTRWVNVSL